MSATKSNTKRASNKKTSSVGKTTQTMQSPSAQQNLVALNNIPTLPEKVEIFLDKKVSLWAKIVKTILQMSIGIVLIFLVFVWLLNRITGSEIPLFDNIYNLHILAIVGDALLISSAIELAYTLFTPGPDEAVEPLITGLAALILQAISVIDFNPSNNGALVNFQLIDDIARNVIVYILALLVLFFIRKAFINDVK